MQPTSEKGDGAHAGSPKRRGDVAQGPSRHRSFSVFPSRARVCECADGCVGVRVAPRGAVGSHRPVLSVGFNLPHSQNVYV